MGQTKILPALYLHHRFTSEPYHPERFEQAVSYYQFAIVNYIGFKDKGIILTSGCGDTNGKQIYLDLSFVGCPNTIVTNFQPHGWNNFKIKNGKEALCQR